MTEPFDVSGITLYERKLHARGDVIFGLEDSTEFPEFGESDLEGSDFVGLCCVAGVDEDLAVYFSEDDVLGLEVVFDVGKAFVLDWEDGLLKA